MSHLQMLGLAGGNKGRSRFRDNLRRRKSHPLKDLPVFFPGILVPPGRAADIEAAVLILYEVAVAVKLSQNAGRKALDVLCALRIIQKVTLKPELSLNRIGAVAGLLTD